MGGFSIINPVPLSEEKQETLNKAIVEHAHYVAEDVNTHSASYEPIEKLEDETYEQRVYLYDAELLWNDLTRIARKSIGYYTTLYYYDVNEAMQLLTSTVTSLLPDEWSFFYEDGGVYIHRTWASLEELQEAGLEDLLNLEYEEVVSNDAV